MSAPAPTRRAVLGRLAAAAPLAGAAALPTAAGDPDPHPGWMAERAAAYEAWKLRPDLPDDHPAEAAFWRRHEELEDLVCATPARTVAGIRAQVALYAEVAEHSVPGEAYDEGLRNALATLDRLAGEARHA